MTQEKKNIVCKVLVNAIRFLLAAVFIFSGFVKAVDPLGTYYKIEDYLISFGISSFFPSIILILLTILLIAAEFCIGVFFLLGVHRKETSLLALIMLMFYTPLTLYIAIFNPVSDCGCFGDVLTLTNWQTFLKNLFLLLMVVFVCRNYRDIVRFITVKLRWLVSLYTLMYIVVLSLYCLFRLPILDFRPYKIGVNIREAMEIPEGAKPDVLESRFLMEKDGKRQEFTENNYPDSTWTLVSKRVVLKEKGYTPKIHDFMISDMETGEDITDSLLNSKNYTFLLVIHLIEIADDSNIDLINEAYDYSQEHGYGFYALTSSSEEEIEKWCDRTGAEYPFCIADDVTLKTIIRANPGLMLIKDGVILNKWSGNSLPDEYELTGKLDGLSIGNVKEVSNMRVICNVLLWFVIPLLLIWMVDMVVTRKKDKKEELYLNKKRNNMRKKIVAGNWKMNLNLQEGIALAKELNETLKVEKPNCGVVICTPFIHLASIAQFLDQDVVGLGAENCADKEKGAYTGEVSAAMVKSTGAQYVILGHSERREYYKETPEILKEKVLLALANGLKVIFCIGESLDEREANKQNEVVKAELEGSVFNLSAEDFSKIVIAYEPIWAIGTGKTATAEQAEEIHAYIRSVIAEKYGQQVADDTTILYGGSCKASNAPELFAKPDIDGGLIGGASLKAADFKGIIDAWK